MPNRVQEFEKAGFEFKPGDAVLVCVPERQPSLARVIDCLVIYEYGRPYVHGTRRYRLRAIGSDNILGHGAELVVPEHAVHPVSRMQAMTDRYLASINAGGT